MILQIFFVGDEAFLDKLDKFLVCFVGSNDVALSNFKHSFAVTQSAHSILGGFLVMLSRMMLCIILVWRCFYLY